MAVRLLLNPVPADIECVPGQPDDMEGIHDRDSVRKFFCGGSFEPGESVHGHDFHTVPRRQGASLQPGSGHLLRVFFHHVQQPGRSIVVADGGEVDDDGDVLVPAPGMPPNTLVNTNDFYPVETLEVINEHSSSLGEDGFIRGVPGNAEAVADQAIVRGQAHDSFQRPAQLTAGDLRPGVRQPS